MLYSTIRNLTENLSSSIYVWLASNAALPISVKSHQSLKGGFCIRNDDLISTNIALDFSTQISNRSSGDGSSLLVEEDIFSLDSLSSLLTSSVQL